MAPDPNQSQASETSAHATGLPRFGLLMLVILSALTAFGLFETARRSSLADWYEQQSNVCAQAVADFEERAESFAEHGQDADAESCARSAIILTRQLESHQRMAGRLRQHFWQDWVPR
jgi:hypothetical protein